MSFSGKLRVTSFWMAVSSCAIAVGQSAAQQTTGNGTAAACTLAPPTFVSGAPNIFTDQQEQYLGDALAEQVEADLRLAPVNVDDPLTKIGLRLLAALPPSGLQYRFRIYDSGEINAFSLGGGRVYISRKMLAAVKNEDELAGIVAHEIGHIATHQFGTEFTRTFGIRLGVTQVTDRADIFARVHQMLSTPAKPAEREVKEDKDQLLADHAALFAMVRAGYAPESFVTFLDKITVNKGKTGNAITDLFGRTHEASQRYRSGLKLIAALPVGCKGRPPEAKEAFLAWQRSVVEERIQSGASNAEGDVKVKLSDPLRPDLWNIRFSPDGRYLLAQDEGGISVVDRDARKILFRMDAPNAETAQFTPNSESVVFHDERLRVERWDVATGKRTRVNELVVFDGCAETLLSADGNTLVCAKVDLASHNPSLALQMIDVESGKPYFEKKNFYVPVGNAMSSLILDIELKAVTGLSIVNMHVSQDGRYLIATVRDRSLAFDFERREEVPLGGKLHGIGQTRMAFMADNQLYVRGETKASGMRKGSILSFPDGQLLKESQIGRESEIGDHEVNPITKGALIKLSPVKTYAVGIFDPQSGKFVSASKTDAMDVWNTLVAMEGTTGGLQLSKLGVTENELIPLPLGNLPNPRAAAFTRDGNYLALSLKNRAELWSLETGKKIALTRPFRSVWVDEKENLYVQFEKFMDKDPLQMRFNLDPLEGHEMGTFEPEDVAYHDMRLRFRADGWAMSTTYDAVLEVRKMEDQAVAWSRTYSKETPACWEAEDNRLVLAWDLNTDGAKLELKGLPVLQKELEGFKDKKRGLLLETVVPETGAPLEQVVVPEADLTHGWYDSRRAMVSGQYVLVRGEHGNTVIYRLDTGAKIGEFFGLPVASDASLSLVAATNREDEIVLVEESTGKELKRFSLGSAVRVARVIHGKQNQLLVLTADQVVHRLSLPGSGKLAATLTH